MISWTFWVDAWEHPFSPYGKIGSSLLPPSQDEVFTAAPGPKIDTGSVENNWDSIPVSFTGPRQDFDFLISPDGKKQGGSFKEAPLTAMERLQTKYNTQLSRYDDIADRMKSGIDRYMRPIPFAGGFAVGFMSTTLYLLGDQYVDAAMGMGTRGNLQAYSYGLNRLEENPNLKFNWWQLRVES